MYQYVLRRLLYALPTLLGITLLIFFVLRILPGDPLVILYGEGGVGSLSDADRAAIRHQLGFDRPLYQQYASWLKDLLTGNLGQTLARGDSVADILWERGILTGEIAVLAVLVSWLVGLPTGILSALWQNSAGDYLARFCTILFLAVPGFWVAMLVVIGTLAVFHYRPPLGIIAPWEDPLANLKIVVGPGVVLGLGTSAYIARLARSSFLEVIREDYVRTARAKGVRETLVVFHHALRNAHPASPDHLGGPLRLSLECVGGCGAGLRRLRPRHRLGPGLPGARPAGRADAGAPLWRGVRGGQLAD